MSGIIHALKIVLLCFASAIVYGIVHDQFTVRICLEYFTVFYSHIFPTRSPTLLAVGWGILATWWVGAFLGVLLAIAARAGSKPKLAAHEVLPYIVRLLLFMGLCAIAAGAIGYLLVERGLIALSAFIAQTPALVTSNFMADWWAHSASYAGGFFGGLVVCPLVYRKRMHLGNTLERELVSN
jgi:hypothetical protein